MAALELLALSPREGAAYLAVSKRTPSRLIRSKKIAAR
jgi:excisionase family DNA binding protein